MADTDRDSGFAAEIRHGARFGFGNNWRRFLKFIDDERICQSEKNLKEFLQTDSLQGKTFLDVGCGSGLSSLAARRLGARVVSFDYDPESVHCALKLKEKYFKDDQHWQISNGSVLDTGYLHRLGAFDIVYAWGVLHHTGAMWQALENVKINTTINGRLYIAIYNDCGRITRQWAAKKVKYNSLPGFLKLPYALKVWLPIGWREFRRRPRKCIKTWTEYKKNRGMSRWHDMIDWLGGYPYENASAQALIDFYRKDGYRLLKIEPNHGYGCHQIVFARTR